MAELPTLTLPKLSDDGLNERVLVAATPVPLRPITVAGVAALLVRLMLPVALPAVCGANCTLKVLLWAAGMVSGVVIPLTVKPVPVALICEIFRSAVPVLVMVTAWDLDWPSTRLPKLILAGETLMAGWTPVPVMARPGATPGASLAMPTVPPRSPVVVGAKVTAS